MRTVIPAPNWMMFLDDERDPATREYWRVVGPCPVVVVRTVDAARENVIRRGLPSFISFDHDLGDNEPTGYDFAHWLADHIMDHDIPYADFDWYVHSQNPVGAENINRFLTNFLPVWKSGAWKTP